MVKGLTYQPHIFFRLSSSPSPSIFPISTELCASRRRPACPWRTKAGSTTSLPMVTLVPRSSTARGYRSSDMHYNPDFPTYYVRAHYRFHAACSNYATWTNCPSPGYDPYAMSWYNLVEWQLVCYSSVTPLVGY